MKLDLQECYRFAVFRHFPLALSVFLVLFFINFLFTLGSHVSSEILHFWLHERISLWNFMKSFLSLSLINNAQTQFQAIVKETFKLRRKSHDKTLARLHMC